MFIHTNETNETSRNGNVYSCLVINRILVFGRLKVFLSGGSPVFYSWRHTAPRTPMVSLRVDASDRYASKLL